MDTLVRGMLNNEARVYACDISNMANEAHATQKTMPAATIALGRTLAGVTLMSAMLKSPRDKLTLSINGGGPAGTIMAVGDAALHIKGYIANPNVNVPPSPEGGINIAGAVGTDGFVTVVRDIGLREPYIGKTKVETGEIAEDLAHYFLKSEQQPSIVYLNTWLETDFTVVNAGGIIITPLPGCSEETLFAIEERICDIKNYAIYMMGNSPKKVVQKIFEGMDIQILDELFPEYRCDCGRERLREVLAALGRDELLDMILKDKGAQIVCRFCSKEYDFTEQELAELAGK